MTVTRQHRGLRPPGRLCPVEVQAAGRARTAGSGSEPAGRWLGAAAVKAICADRAVAAVRRVCGRRAPVKDVGHAKGLNRQTDHRGLAV